ncbi:MAG TPA: hypothetical protein VJ600_10795 [Holophagaceae bacterium]|nr:hypothetical protein [Holophagaceae bacterium]
MKTRILILVPALALLGLSSGCIIPVHDQRPWREGEHDRGRHEGERKHDRDRGGDRDGDRDHDHGPSLSR